MSKGNEIQRDTCTSMVMVTAALFTIAKMQWNIYHTGLSSSESPQACTCLFSLIYEELLSVFTS
jgi:hypothetical protein